MYGLDPCHFLTSPALSWQAMLKPTGASLELLTNIDMLLFFAKAIHRGLVQVSGRHSLAHHPYMGERYDATRVLPVLHGLRLLERCDLAMKYKEKYFYLAKTLEGITLPEFGWSTK